MKAPKGLLQLAITICLSLSTLNLIAQPTTIEVFGDISDPKSRVSRLVHQKDKLVWVLRPEVGALPNVYYMND